MNDQKPERHVLYMDTQYKDIMKQYLSVKSRHQVLTGSINATESALSGK